MASAHDEIRRLIYAYAERLDAGDFAAVGRLFAAARYGAGEGPLGLSGADVERLHGELVILYEDGTPRTKHVTTNVAIELDAAGRGARAHSYYVVLQQVPGGPLQPIVSGRYEDRFELADGRWRFAARRIHVDLVGDLSRHLRTIPAGVR
ncbi:MAG: nuclear transport factor 2 family protein [Deltaproteobacteria bacterium]|nr:MAG: nuclear transport factor 2 family protein [Deltaproteobacteria bacterium]